MPGYDVGSVRATLSALADLTGFNRFERAYDQSSVKAQRPVKANLGAEMDRRGFVEYERALERARAQASRREAYKAHFGADFDEGAFRRAEQAMTRLAGAAGGAGGGADEFRVSLGFLGGAARAMGPVLIGITPVVTALGGALVAVAGSAAAAAGGVGALGVGLAGALTPVGALVAAVGARFEPIGQALDALTTQSERSGFEAQQAAARQEASDARIRASQQQVAAARRGVQDAERGVADAQRNAEFAQDSLSRAREAATRQLEDMRRQVQGLRLDEESASLSVREAQQALDELIQRRRQGQDVTPLEVERAQLNVREAQRRLADVQRERQDVQTQLQQDRRAGINQMPQVVAAQRALADAQRQVAAQMRGVRDAERQVTQSVQDLGTAHQAAATDTAAGIDQVALAMARLDPAERRFVLVLQRVRAQIQEATRPATDAVIGGLGSAAASAGNFAQRLSAPFARLGEAIGDAIAEGASELTSNRFLARFRILIESATRLVRPFREGLVAVADIFTNIAVAAQPFVRDVVNALARGLQGIAGQTSNVGAVRDVIRDLLRSTRDWFNLFRAVGELLFTVFAGGKSSGDSLVVSLTRVVDKWNAFLKTKDGQRDLRQFLHDAVEATKVLAGIVGALTSTFFDLGRTIDHVASDPMGAFRETVRQVQDSRLVDWVKEVADTFDDAWNSIAETAESAFRGVRETILRAFDKILDVAEELPGVGGKFRDLREGVQRDLQAIAEERHTDRIKDNLRKVREASEDTADSFHDLERRHANSFENIQNTTAERTDKIRRDMGTNSQQGREAMADNFRRAAAAVRKSMDDGRTSTREGLRAIRDYMVSALDLYGVDIHQARALVRNRTTPGRGNVNQFGQNEGGGGSGDQTGNQRGGMVRRFMSGGWLVGRGLVGSDTVQVGPNAWAAPGEYQALGPGNMAGIFTRHQQREMSPFLAQGGYTWDTLPRDQRALPLLEALTSQIGGLATVFSMIDRPHMFQAGGVTGDTDYGPAMARALSALARAAGISIFVQSGGRSMAEQAALVRQKGVYSASNPTGAAPPSPSAPHIRGIAADITPGREALGRLAGRFGLGFPLPAEPWHIQLTNPGAAVAAVPVAFPQVGVRGGGAMGRVANAAVQMVRGAARRTLGAAATGTGAGGDNAPSSTGAGADPAVISAFRQAIAALRANPTERLALWEAGLVESGLRNLPYGDADSVGALQQRPSQGWTGLMNPYRAAVEFLQRAIAKRPWRGTAGQLAQAVQISNYPARYDATAGAARQFLGRGGRFLRRGLPAMFQTGGVRGFPVIGGSLALIGTRVGTPGDRIRQLLVVIDNIEAQRALHPNDVALMQTLLTYEQEVLRLARRVGNNDLIRQYAPEVQQLRQDIRDAQAPEFTRQDRLDRDLAVAQLGGDPVQVRGVLTQQLGGARGRLARAQRRGDVTGEAQAARDVASLVQSIQDLDQQLADKARQDAENARQARIQALDTKDALAALTSGLGDDAEAVNASVAFWNDQLARAQESGDPVAIADAARNFGSAVQRQDQVADVIRRQPLAWIEANQAQARLTASLDDDINAARDMVGFWQRMLEDARRDQSPERITDAANSLASATEDLNNTIAQQGQTASQIADAASQMLRAFQDNLRSLYGGMGSNFVVPGATPFGQYVTPHQFGALGGLSSRLPGERPNVVLNVNRVVETSDPHIWASQLARESSLAF